MATGTRHRRACAAAGLAAFGLAQVSAAGADMPAAGGDEILAGARSCMAATSPAGVDANTLAADGWSAATLSNNGKPAGGTLRFFGRGSLLVMLNAADPTPLCVVTARIASVHDFAPLQAAMAAAYGAPFKDDGKGEQMYITLDRHIVDLASTGSNQRPAVRVAVGTLPQETK